MELSEKRPDSMGQNEYHPVSAFHSSVWIWWICYECDENSSSVNMMVIGIPRGAVVKNPPVHAGDTGDTGSIRGSGRSPGGGNRNPLQYSCLENPHGQRSLVGFSPWGCKELAVTEHACRHMQEKANTQTDSEGTPWLFLTLLNEGCMCHLPPCV